MPSDFFKDLARFRVNKPTNHPPSSCPTRPPNGLSSISYILYYALKKCGWELISEIQYYSMNFTFLKLKYVIRVMFMVNDLFFCYTVQELQNFPQMHCNYFYHPWGSYSLQHYRFKKQMHLYLQLVLCFQVTIQQLKPTFTMKEHYCLCLQYLMKLKFKPLLQLITNISDRNFHTISSNNEFELEACS